MRELIHVPLVHSREALILDQTIKPEQAQEYNFGSQEFYQQLESELAKLNLENPRLYCDGYYGDTREVETITEAKAMAILNFLNKEYPASPPEFSTFIQLFAKGLILEHTEHRAYVSRRQLLVQKLVEIDEETKRNFGLDEALPENVVRQYGKILLSLDYLMQQGDAYIEQRIADTLKEGEVGTLLMGAGHDVVSKLPRNIRVKYLNEGSRELAIETAMGFKAKVWRFKQMMSQEKEGTTGKERKI